MENDEPASSSIPRAHIEEPPLFDNPEDILRPSADDEKLLREVRQEFPSFKKEQETLMVPIWDECYKMYRIQTPDASKSGDWRSRIHVPHGFNNVEDVTPHLMEGIFGSDKPFKVTSKKNPQLAEAHQRAAMHQWRELMDAETKWEEGQKTKAIYGTTGIFSGFKLEVENRKFWRTHADPFGLGLPPVAVVESEDVPVYVGNYMEIILPYSLYPHPKATADKIRKLYWVKNHTLKELADLGQGRFRNLDKLEGENGKALRNMGPDSDTRMPPEAITTMGEMNRTFEPTDDSENEFRVLFRFDDINKTWAVLAGPEGKEVVLCNEQYPWFHMRCPILFDRYLIVPKEFWGVGAIEPSVPLMHEADTIRNQRRDNVTMAMNGMLEVRESEIDDEEAELVSRPFGVVHSRSGQAVRPIQFPLVVQDALREEETVRRDIREQSGLGGALVGQTDPNTPSGTKFSLQQKGQLLRISRAIKRQALVIKDLVYMMVSNNMQFYPVKEMQEILGPQLFESWDTMTDKPHDISLHASIEVQPVGLFADEDLLRQQFTNLINVYATIPQLNAQLNWRGVAKRGLSMFPDIPDVELLLQEDTPMVDVMEMRMAHQENLAMAAGQRIAPAEPGEDPNVHLPMHYHLLESRPELFMAVGEHIQSHETARQQEQMMQLQQEQRMSMGGGRDNGPGSRPSGNNGGVDPNRQSQASDQEGLIRSVARQQGRRGA